jgi:hypothetical protein
MNQRGRPRASGGRGRPIRVPEPPCTPRPPKAPPPPRPPSGGCGTGPDLSQVLKKILRP